MKKKQSYQGLLIVCSTGDIKVFDNQDGNFILDPTKSNKVKANTEPFFADLNGDYKEDMLYSDVDNKIKVWENGQSIPFDDYVKTDDGCLTPDSGRRLAHPHSNAFIDFNGDCIADLFLTTVDSSGYSWYEIYTQTFVNEGSKYCLVK
jgi:hypothetical protein